MRSPQKFAQDSDGLSSRWQLNQTRIFALGNSRIRPSQYKHTHVKTRRIKPAYDLARIAHLSIGQIRISKAIHQNSNRFQLIRSSLLLINSVRPACKSLRPFNAKFSYLGGETRIHIP